MEIVTQRMIGQSEMMKELYGLVVQLVESCAELSTCGVIQIHVVKFPTCFEML